MTPSYPSSEPTSDWNNFPPDAYDFDYDYLYEIDELDDEFDTDDWYEHPEVEEEDEEDFI